MDTAVKLPVAVCFLLTAMYFASNFLHPQPLLRYESHHQQEVHVAHCVSGEVRSLTDPVIHQSMHTNFFQRFSPGAQRVDIFLYLSLKNQTCSQDGTSEDMKASLLSDAISVLRPYKVIIHDDDAGDNAAKHAQPGCLAYCQNQWRKWELCLDAVESAERSLGIMYTWITKTRPDSLWAQPIATHDTLSNTLLFNAGRGIVIGRNTNPACGFGGIDHAFVFPRTVASMAMRGLRTRSCAHAKQSRAPTCEKDECFGCECALYDWWRIHNLTFVDGWAKYGWANYGGIPSKWVRPYPPCIPSKAPV